ncbi:MAG: hypothetical protein RL189_133 [Pseudomonadota bacterium]|jgi:uncharacterized membrane protein YebE (DUF533 family)
MKKLFAALLVFFFLQTQNVARANPAGLDVSFAQMASEVTQGKLSSTEIVSKAKQAVSSARASGMTEEQFVAHLSKKLALNMSDEDVRQTVEDLRANHSPSKISELAESLRNTQKDDKVLMVLLTFALLSALWIGIFFILADPHFPH